MRLLLDTHALLWFLFDLPLLGPATRGQINTPSSEVHVSAVTAAEIAIKKATGKMESPGDLTVQLPANGFAELPFTVWHAEAMTQLPLLHRDPFDRMLIAQARAEGLTLVTSDRAITAYDVPKLWARD